MRPSIVGVLDCSVLARFTCTWVGCQPAVFQGMAEIGGRRLFSALRFLSRSERYFFLRWAPR